MSAAHPINSNRTDDVWTSFLWVQIVHTQQYNNMRYIYESSDNGIFDAISHTLVCDLYFTDNIPASRTTLSLSAIPVFSRCNYQ